MRINTFIADHIENGIAYIENSKEVNHLKNVLRINIGASVRVIDGKQGYMGEVYKIQKNIEIKLVEKLEDIYSLNSSITAYISIIKPNIMSNVVRHLTELGILRIIPVITDFSNKSNLNIERMNHISREAAKQCGAIKFTTVENPVHLSNIPFSDYTLFVSAIENRDTKLINDIKRCYNVNDTIAYLVGPEGGFSDGEKKLLSERTTPINFGNRIYRAETASLALGSLLVHYFLER